MKKNLEKIFASASIIVAIVLIMILLVTIFGGISTEEFDSSLVRGLMITLALLYVVLSAIVLVFAFSSSEAIKEITLRSEQSGSVKATKSVVTKIVKETCLLVEGVKCQRVGIITNDYGVRLRMDVKIKDMDVVETELKIRAMIEDKFLGELGFRFHAVEIKITSLVSKYQINDQAVADKVKVQMEELRVEAENAAVESAKGTGVDAGTMAIKTTKAAAAKELDADIKA